MNMQNTGQVRLSENIILADADYIDYVAFQLIVQFERMIGRSIPQADLCRWLMNIALDGGLRADGEQHETQVVLVHEKKKLENFIPCDFVSELNGKAFKDEGLGEFLITCVETGKIVGKDEYMLETLRLVSNHDEVKRLMIVPDSERGNIYDRVRQDLRAGSDDRRVTLFAMQPMQGGNFRQEILGYSLMNALGIKAEELE